MPVKTIEFQSGNLIDKSFHFCDGEEMTAAVQMNSTVGKSGLVRNTNPAKRIRILNELIQTLQSIAKTLIIAVLNVDSLV
ncbi:hypothetical protein D3C85_1307470 [compost metagenome]